MKHLPQAEFIYEYRSSSASGPAHQREEFRIGFFACYDKIWELIDSRNDLQHYQDGFQVLGVPTIIERVAREALLNAASHRSYRMSSSVFVRQYRDTLVVESPGGLPSGITLSNILERQAPRNHLIANVFALCGLVERAGQGMNLIYELCIKEAKALPDFKGTDPYFVSIMLNGLITDEKLLLLFKRIESDVLESFTTEDYLAINSLFHTQKFPQNLRANVRRLADIGIIEHLGHGKYLIAKQLYSSVGESNTHSRLAEMDRAANKKLILHHIQSSSGDGVSLGELLQVFPNSSRSQMQKMIYELRGEGKVKTEGKTHGARWFIV
jgi:ATP-dependent DNA helicase RecG